MRRPLKPFVTEYKQSNRRSPNLPTEPNAFETERPAPRLVDTSLRDSEDSYEAAMRAADALFSPKPVSEPRESREPAPRWPTPAEPSSSPIFETEPRQTSSSEKPGGRILRVLDEAPPPELVALEAERAPKRRGRKPGSKNKPKIVPVEGLLNQGTAEPTFEVASRPVTRAKRPAVQQVAAIEVDAVPALKTMPRSVKRFPWARDRLKPGEDWKRRRLPKVCW